MTNYKNIIEKTKKPNFKNKSNTSIKIINQNNSKKDYKNNLLKLSNKNQISIFLQALNFIQNNIKKVISTKLSKKNL